MVKNDDQAARVEPRVMPHLVYFVKANRYPWVKVGMSRDHQTLDKRVQHIAGREPFEVELIGVSSTVRELQMHNDLSAHHVRSEWFRWCKDVSDYAKKHCDVFHVSRDGRDGWWMMMDDLAIEAHNARTQEISQMLKGLRSA